jgi:hypothetical protein
MATITPTTPTFTQVIAPVVVTNGNLGTRTTLDLTTKRGAYLYGRIGRRTTTALTRSGYIAVRPTNNTSLSLPGSRFDLVSSIAAAISTTLNGAVSAAATTYVLTSATSFAIGDVLCLHSDDTNANRVEFSKVAGISSNTITPDFSIAIAHNNADRVTTQGDVFASYIPGGDIYEIRAVNPSGQDLVFALDVVVDNGDTY